MGSELGRQIRALRLRQNLDQQQLAERAGIALNAVKNLESGKGATLRSLIQALRVLNRVDWLRALAPAVSISPVQMLKAKAPRQRASRRRRKTSINGQKTRPACPRPSPSSRSASGARPSAPSRSIPQLGYYAFEYQPAFVRSGIELAPLTMPLAAASEPFVFADLPELTYRRLPGMLADALPDDFGNALIDAWMAREGVDQVADHVARSPGLHGQAGHGCAGVQAGARPQAVEAEHRD